ncbi:hypothetical protein MRX96_018157 [Rhipicephalus microplus]
MTVYLPGPGILRCLYPCCAGCQARTSALLRLSAWRSHMEQKHGVRPTRRLYRCVACDARLNSLSARHDCPGPASNEPFHPCRYCPSYFNCERSLARHTVARHAQEESTPYIPLRTPRQPTATPSSSSGTETTPPPGPAPSGTFCRAAPEPHTRATVPRSRRRRGGQSSTSRPSSSTGSASSSTATGSLSASSSEASIKPGHSSATSSSGSSTPRQSPSVPGTPPSVPPDPGPPSTTGEVSSTPGSSSRRHTGPGSTSSASRASSRMSTELADVPGTDDYDDASANEPVDEQSVLAVGTVVDHRPLSTNSRSSSSPSLSERLEDTGADDADDGAHDTPVEAPTMEMPPNRTMLLAEQESPAIYRRGGPTKRSRRPPGVVRVYKPSLTCHSRPGRQCLLTTLTGPGPRDHLAAVVRVYQPGRQATGTWTSTDEAFQSSQREKTPSGSGESPTSLFLPATPGPVANARW